MGDREPLLGILDGLYVVLHPVSRTAVLRDPPDHREVARRRLQRVPVLPHVRARSLPSAHGGRRGAVLFRSGRPRAHDLQIVPLNQVVEGFPGRARGRTEHGVDTPHPDRHPVRLLPAEHAQQPLPSRHRRHRSASGGMSPARLSAIPAVSSTRSDISYSDHKRWKPPSLRPPCGFCCGVAPLRMIPNPGPCATRHRTPQPRRTPGPTFPRSRTSDAGTLCALRVPAPMGACLNPTVSVEGRRAQPRRT